LGNYVDELRKLTNDSQILDIVGHCHIDLELNEHNCVTNARAQYNFSTKEHNIIQKEVEKLLDLKVVIEVEPYSDQMLSPIFLRPMGNIGWF